MATKKKIEIFTAGCPMCKETIELVKRAVGSSRSPHEVIIHDMHKPDVAFKAKQYGVCTVPAVVIDGKLASWCASRAPDEHILLASLYRRA